MMNEPVAWIDKDTLDATHIIKAVVRREQDEQHNIPLYTHPVKDKPHPKCDEACMYLCQMRELTDEEIMEIVADKYEKGHGRYIDTKLFFVEFAKEILKKAQEK